MNMVFMYTKNSKLKGWWENVRLIIWGPSAKLLAGNRMIQREVDFLLQSSIIVEACEGCTEAYGITEQIHNMGITVRYMGEPLTEILQSDEKLIVF